MGKPAVRITVSQKQQDGGINFLPYTVIVPLDESMGEKWTPDSAVLGARQRISTNPENTMTEVVGEGEIFVLPTHLIHNIKIEYLPETWEDE